MLAKSIAYGLVCLPLVALLYALAHGSLQGRAWTLFTRIWVDVGWPVAIVAAASMAVVIVASLFLFAQCVRHLGMVVPILVRRCSGAPYQIFCTADATEFLDSDGRHYRFDRHAPGLVCPLSMRDGSGWIIFRSFDSPSGAAAARVRQMSHLFAVALSVSAFRRIPRSAFYVPISGAFDAYGILATYTSLLAARPAATVRQT